MAGNDQSNPDSAMPVYIAGGSGHGSGWAKTANGTPLTTTAAATVMAAMEGMRQYITGIQLVASNNTATVIKVIDDTTVIWETYLAGSNSNGASVQPISFTTPIVCSENKPLKIQAGTGGCSVYWNMQGYSAT